MGWKQNCKQKQSIPLVIFGRTGYFVVIWSLGGMEKTLLKTLVIVLESSVNLPWRYSILQFYDSLHFRGYSISRFSKLFSIKTSFRVKSRILLPTKFDTLKLGSPRSGKFFSGKKNPVTVGKETSGLCQPTILLNVIKTLVKQMWDFLNTNFLFLQSNTKNLQQRIQYVKKNLSSLKYASQHRKPTHRDHLKQTYFFFKGDLHLLEFPVRNRKVCTKYFEKNETLRF